MKKIAPGKSCGARTIEDNAGRAGGAALARRNPSRKRVMCDLKK